MKKFFALLAFLIAIPLTQAQVPVSVSGTYRNAALGNVPINIKAAKGLIQWQHCLNLNGTVEYVQYYDLAGTSTISIGTTVPKLTLPVGTGSLDRFVPVVANFFNGINVMASSSTSGSGTPTTPLVCNFGFN